MTRPVSALLLLTACGSGCAALADRSAPCDWTNEPAATLDLRNASQRRHLAGDALAAEDVAIRYADARRGHRSGNYDGAAAYRDARERCMAALFETIASRHGVTVPQVHAALGNRNTLSDFIVVASFYLVYVYGAARVAGWLVRSLDFDARWPVVVATLVASVPMSLAGVLSGALWSGVIEMIRIGNDHLSYRAERIPWDRHWTAILLACAGTFTLTAFVEYRRHRRAGFLM